MSKALFATALATLLIASPSFAQQPKLNNKTWADAAPDVAAMKENELRALIGYLAECSERTSRDSRILQGCKSARIKYQAEFKQDRAIDALIDDIETIYALQQMYRSLEVYPKTDHVDGLQASVLAGAGAALRARNK